MHSLTFRYSAAELRRRILSELWTHQGAWAIAAGVLFLMGCLLSASRDNAWPGGFAIGAALTYFAIIWGHAARRRGLVDRELKMDLTAEGIAITGPWGMGTYPWGAVKRMREASDGLVLEVWPDGHGIHLPTAVATAMVRDYIRVRIESLRPPV